MSEKLNIDPGAYYGLGVLWLDYDLDGCLDLYVANDSSPSLLYHNNCKGGFTEVGAESGVAYSADDGREQAGMGIDSADYDHDGWPDIVKTNFSDDTNSLYHYGPVRNPGRWYSSLPAIWSPSRSSSRVQGGSVVQVGGILEHKLRRSSRQVYTGFHS